MRQALHSLAAAAADWLRAWVPTDWSERYGRRVEEYRLAKGQQARIQYAETAGRGGLQLVEKLWAPNAPASLQPSIWWTPALCGPRTSSPARDHQIDLIGPLPSDHQWQARAKQGFALSQFSLSWIGTRRW
jgi:hypothetical protein